MFWARLAMTSFRERYGGWRWNHKAGEIVGKESIKSASKDFKSANFTAISAPFWAISLVETLRIYVKSHLSQLSTKLCVFASVSWRHPFNVFCFCDTWTLLGGIRIVISIHQNSPGGYSGGISSRSSLVPNGITMSALGNKNRNAAVSPWRLLPHPTKTCHLQIFEPFEMILSQKPLSHFRNWVQNLPISPWGNLCLSSAQGYAG